MAQKQIDGVKVTPRKIMPDERGRLVEIFRADEPDFVKFGQVYATTAYPGVVKAWRVEPGPPAHPQGRLPRLHVRQRPRGHGHQRSDGSI
jgi:dTDP-4-dehydrorhamnose 3,5-epimerase-like enzyme